MATSEASDFMDSITVKDEPIEYTPNNVLVEMENTEKFLKKRHINTVTTVQCKKEIIKKLEHGASISELVSEYKLSKSIIVSILKNKNMLKSVNVAKGVKIITKQRPRELEDVEKLLLLWINRKKINGEFMSKASMIEKAKQLFMDISKEKSSSSEKITFKASDGWFKNFRRRSGLYKYENTKAGKVSTERFLNRIKNHINTEGLLPQQIFTCNETVFTWKKLPKKMPLTPQEEPEPEEENHWVTVLLCSNATGDLKVKPLLVKHSEFLEINHENKKSSPVLLRLHPKGWITKELFIEWMNEVLGPIVEKYLLDNNLPKKALFVFDNAPTHPVDFENSLKEQFKFIKAKVLPTEAVFLLRPLDQDVISSFKRLYVKVLLQCCASAISYDQMTLKIFWQYHLDLHIGVKLVARAWNEVSSSRISRSWKRILPNCFGDINNELLDDECIATMDEILSLSDQLELNIDSNDVEELLCSYKTDLSTSDLIELQKEQVELPKDPEEAKNIFPVSYSLIEDMYMKWEEVESFVRAHHPYPKLINQSIAVFHDEVLKYFVDILKGSNMD